MSRGLGALQKVILDELQTGERQFNQLCWTTAARVDAADVAGLPRSFYASFQRGVSQLEARGIVSTTQRKLIDLTEVSNYYPYRPRERAILEMRKRLLPQIANYVERRPSKVKFDYADTERRHVKLLTPERLQAARETWNDVEDRTLIRMSSAKHEHRANMCLLVAKGREVFGLLRGELATTLWSYVNVLHSSFPDLRLEETYWNLFPRDVLAPLFLKTRLYPAISAGNSGASEVQRDFKEFLFKYDADFLRSLPGHIEPSGRRRGTLAVLYDGRRFSSLLNRLVNRDVFGPFAFVTPALPR